MKKFITLLSAAFIAVASLATVASAAPITEDVFKPTIEADITKLNKNGDKATVTFKVNVESDLDLYCEDDYWYGFGMRSWQIDIDTNNDIFVDDVVKVGSAVNDLKSVLVSEDGAVVITKAIALKPEYQGKDVAVLNALPFGEVTYAEFIISSWDEADDFSQEVTQTKYRSDDDGDFVIDLSVTRVGTYVDEPVTPPAPPADPDFVLTEKTDADAAWEAETGKNAVYWGVKFAEGKFNNYSKVVFKAGEETRERVFKAGDGFVVNGEVEFAIVVIADEAITNVVTADIQ